MEKNMKQKHSFQMVKSPGEAFVWFSSMGLTIGLIMVACLLIVIISHGIGVFWPDEVAQIQLKKGSSAALGDSQYLAGRIVEKREKAVKNLDLKESNAEWQLFIGNKDVYGLAFRFVDYKSIEKVTYPRDLISIERLEYGDAIGIPKSLQIKGQQPVQYPGQNFMSKLETVVGKDTDRREEIEEIEKSKIGLINHDMEQLRIQEKVIHQKKNLSPRDEVRTKEIQSRMKALQVDYEGLAQKAQQLRGKQNEDFLVYKLVTGEEKQLSVGQIVSFYLPNQLNFWQRIGLTLQRLWNFVSQDPREANTEGGIFPAIFGTFVMTLLLSIAVTPFGVLAAIYLREYARQGIFVRSVRIAVNNLAGVPSIVFGIFGLGFFVYVVGGTIDRLFFSQYLPTPTFGTGGILWAALTLALMTVPVVIVATEEALAAVPRGVREGSLACGASKWQTIKRVVLPASAPGILTGLILAMARGAGEVAPLMLVGVVKLAPSLPIDGIFPYIHLDAKFMHLGFYIYDLGFQSPDSEAAKPMVFAVTFFLILLVVLLNLGAIVIRERLRRKYATGAF
jgi:phosphate transport system permease protein